jgi:hypothetical protein
MARADITVNVQTFPRGIALVGFFLRHGLAAAAPARTDRARQGGSAPLAHPMAARMMRWHLFAEYGEPWTVAVSCFGADGTEFLRVGGFSDERAAGQFIVQYLTTPSAAVNARESERQQQILDALAAAPAKTEKPQ